jgi:hypothetical protein
MAFWIPKYMMGRLAWERQISLVSGVDPVSIQAAAIARKGLLNEVNFTFGVITSSPGSSRPSSAGGLGDKLRKRYGGAYLLTSGYAILLAFPCTLAMLKWPLTTTRTPFGPRGWPVFRGVFFSSSIRGRRIRRWPMYDLRSSAHGVCDEHFHFARARRRDSPPLIGWVMRETTWDRAFTLVSLMMILASTLWFIGARYLASDEQAAEKAQAELENGETTAPAEGDKA